VIGLVALVGLKRLERGFFPQRRGRLVELRLDQQGALREVAAQAAEVLGGKAEVQRVGHAETGGVLLVLHAQVPRGSDVVDLASRLRELPCVTDVDITA
jgi:hypothetical protein